MAISTTNDAAESWRLIRGAAANARRFAQAYSAELSAGNVTLERVFEMYRALTNIRNQIETEKVTAGLAAYVKVVKDDVLYDVTPDINAVSAAIASVLTWVDGAADSLTLDGDTAANYLVSGSVVSNRFTPGQTAGLRTQLAGIVAAID